MEKLVARVTLLLLSMRYSSHPEYLTTSDPADVIFSQAHHIDAEHKNLFFDSLSGKDGSSAFQYQS